MANKLYEENDIQAIADAIRANTSDGDKYFVSEMAAGVQKVYNEGYSKGLLAGSGNSGGESQGLEYTLNADGKSYAVSMWGTCTDEHIVIPATHDGLPVTMIANTAFYHSSAKSFIIPDSVREIQGNAFGYADAEKIYIPSSVTTIDQAAFVMCDYLTIYCEAASKPDGWNEWWKESYTPVVWNAVNDIWEINDKFNSLGNGNTGGGDDPSTPEVVPSSFKMPQIRFVSMPCSGYLGRIDTSQLDGDLFGEWHLRDEISLPENPLIFPFKTQAYDGETWSGVSPGAAALYYSLPDDQDCEPVYNTTHGWNTEYQTIYIDKHYANPDAFWWLCANGDRISQEYQYNLKFTIEIVGGGELKVGDAIQICRMKSYGKDVTRKKKLRRFCEHTITEEDLNKRFITFEVPYSDKTAIRAFSHTTTMSSPLSPLYFRIRRPKGEINSGSNGGGMTVDAEFSNVVTVWETHETGSWYDQENDEDVDYCKVKLV